MALSRRLLKWAGRSGVKRVKEEKGLSLRGYNHAAVLDNEKERR